MSTTPQDATPAGDGVSRPSRGIAGRIGPDWAAVIVGAVLVLLAVTGLLPSIPFLVK